MSSLLLLLLLLLLPPYLFFCVRVVVLSLSHALLFCDAIAAAFSVRIYHHPLEARVFC
jgi:hypothetical protein